MPHVVNTTALVEEGLITPDLAHEIAQRSRATMLALVVNTLLCGGIIAATFGLILWLADAFAVAVAGLAFLGGGIAVLSLGKDTYRMLGNAAALIGAGMLIGGGAIELVERLEEDAALILFVLGALIAGGGGFAKRMAKPSLGFIAGSVFLMGTALHLTGGAIWLVGTDGPMKGAALLYATAAIAAAGTFINVRLVTALAIAPFAQALDTGTAYYHAAYVFYSPEPTLTILQMGLTTAILVWAMPHLADRYARHAGIFTILAVVVGNLAFLVASLWGDHIGISFFRDERPVYNGTYEEWRQAYDLFEARFIHISEHVYSVIWAVLLASAAWWAAQKGKRGLFNAAMTFAAIHAYTQAFETFSDEPLVYVIGGLAAIPAAWGIWRLNRSLLDRAQPA